MKVLHCLFSLEVMVYGKMKILHVTLFIGGCGFLKQQGKIGTKIGWQGGAHWNKALMNLATMLWVARQPQHHHFNLQKL